MPNTREKLIELLEDRRLEASEVCGSMNKGFGAWYADHLIASGVTIQKWIPVTERLPDKNGEYLCRWINKSVSDAEYESTYGSFGYWFDFWEDEDKKWIAYDGITHWMPLPLDPEGEEL